MPPWLRYRVMARLVRDAHHYFFNLETAPRAEARYRARDEIRRRFVEALRAGDARRPLIAVTHSMGTMIAYDCLKHVADCPPLDGLITVGSPLGLDEVQDFYPSWSKDDGFPSERLQGPWVNVYDPLDVVAGLQPRLAPDFRRRGDPVVDDVREDNWGTWRHSISKYLQGRSLRGHVVDACWTWTGHDWMAGGDGRAARGRRQPRQARGLAGRNRSAAVAVGRPPSGRSRGGPPAAVAGGDPAPLVRDRGAAGVRDGLAAGGAAGAQAAARPDAAGARVRRRGAGQAGRSAAGRRPDRLRSRRGAGPPGPDPQGPVRRRRPGGRPGGGAAPVARDRSLSRRLRREHGSPLAGHQRRGPAGARGGPCRAARCRRRGQAPGGRYPGRVSSAAIRRSTSSTVRPPWPRRSWRWAMRRPPCNRWSDTSSTRRSTASPSAARCGSSPRSGGSIGGRSPARRSSTCFAPPRWSTWKARSRCPAATSGARARRCRAGVTRPCSALDRFDSIENYRRGLERSASVARIGRSVETGVGTGFLLPAAALDPRLGEGYVLVTNAHVVSRRQADLAAGAVHPDEAVITFAALRATDPRRSWASPT